MHAVTVTVIILSTIVTAAICQRYTMLQQFDMQPFVCGIIHHSNYTISNNLGVRVFKFPHLS